MTRTPSVCHPEKRAYAADGRCRACAQKPDSAFAVIPHPTTAVQKRNAELQALYQATEQVEEYARLAKRIVHQHLPEYAFMHLQGAQIAAAKGDTRPAEWALSQVKAGKEGPVAEPPAKTAPETGVRVMIGIGLGNLPQGAVSAQIIDVPVGPNGASEASNGGEQH